jgi:hypothetical protein
MYYALRISLLLLSVTYLLTHDVSSVSFVRSLARSLVRSFVRSFVWGNTRKGNPTRGVFERAVAAAEKAKYW